MKNDGKSKKKYLEIYSDLPQPILSEYSFFKGLKEDYYDLWTDLLQKYVKQNEVTGEIYSGDLINLNSKKELNLLDGLVVE